MKKTYVNKSAYAKRGVRKRQAKKTQSVAKIAQDVLDKNSEWKRLISDKIPSTLATVSQVPLDQLSGLLVYDGPLIPQGNDVSNRNGNRVQMRSLKFNLTLKFGSQPVQVRMVLIRYSNGYAISGPTPNVPDLATFLQDATKPFLSPWLKDSGFKYKKCYDQIIMLGGTSIMTTTKKQKFFKIALKDKNKKIIFENQTDQVPDKNRYCLFAIPNIVPSLPADVPQIQCYSSVSFTDM
ncbi:MAG: hypothetical protein [Cressdnaviricota sp.]|nr:MAG: hypothetical protein [Cressdnaviricota sp.]